MSRAPAFPVAVAAPPDRQVKAIIASEINCSHGVTGIRDTHDHGGPFVDHAVVDLARLFKLSVVRSDHVEFARRGVPALVTNPGCEVLS